MFLIRIFIVKLFINKATSFNQYEIVKYLTERMNNKIDGTTLLELG